MSTIRGTGLRPWLDTTKSHYIHGMVTQRQNRVSSVGGYILLVLVWRQLQAGICVAGEVRQKDVLR